MSHLGAPPSLLVFPLQMTSKSLGFDPSDAFPASQPHPDPDLLYPAPACARVAASGASCPTWQSGGVERELKKKTETKRKRGEGLRNVMTRLAPGCSSLLFMLCVCVCVCVPRSYGLMREAASPSSNFLRFLLPFFLVRARITSVLFVDERLQGGL